MRPNVTLLHTAPVHIATFNRLLNDAAPHLRVEHVVNEELLADAQTVGANDPALISRVHHAMQAAASTGASIVVCTCSTIGGAAERTPTAGRFLAARIDRAMADRAVTLGPRILLVAALESTLGPTTSLIRESALAQKAETTITPLLVEGAWQHFMQGDKSAYVDTIVSAVRNAPRTADVIVLAQASMAPGTERLSDLGVEVLASPAIGVRAILEHFGL